MDAHAPHRFAKPATKPGHLLSPPPLVSTLAVHIDTLSSDDFAGPVNLVCANLPAIATCRFSQSPVTLSAGASTTFTLTVETSALPYDEASNQVVGTIAAALLAPILFFRRRMPRPTGLLLLLAATAALLPSITGCSGKYPACTAPGTYTIQVVGNSTDTSAPITHSRPITLVVTP